MTENYTIISHLIWLRHRRCRRRAHPVQYIKRPQFMFGGISLSFEMMLSGASICVSMLSPHRSVSAHFPAICIKFIYQITEWHSNNICDYEYILKQKLVFFIVQRKTRRHAGIHSGGCLGGACSGSTNNKQLASYAVIVFAQHSKHFLSVFICQCDSAIRSPDQRMRTKAAIVRHMRRLYKRTTTAHFIWSNN